MKKWMGLFLVAVLVLTSIIALAETPVYLNKGGKGPYNAGILPEVKEEIIEGNKKYQEAYNARYQAGIAFRNKMRAGGIAAFDLEALLDSFEINRSNYGFYYKDLFPVKNGISEHTAPGWSVSYIFTNNDTEEISAVFVNNEAGPSYYIYTNNTSEIIDYIY